MAEQPAQKHSWQQALPMFEQVHSCEVNLGHILLVACKHAHLEPYKGRSPQDFLGGFLNGKAPREECCLLMACPLLGWCPHLRTSVRRGAEACRGKSFSGEQVVLQNEDDLQNLVNSASILTTANHCQMPALSSQTAMMHAHFSGLL